MPSSVRDILSSRDLVNLTISPSTDHSDVALIAATRRRVGGSGIGGPNLPLRRRHEWIHTSKRFCFDLEWVFSALKAIKSDVERSGVGGERTATSRMTKSRSAAKSCRAD
jgi:hypothetical protein